MINQCGKCWRILFWLLLISGTVGIADASEKPESVRYQRPMFAYLGIEGTPLQRLQTWQRQELEKTIRSSIERGRFIFVRIPVGSGREGLFVRQMVKIVSARSEGVARMRAAWDSQFQEYAITSDMLESIQNNSFFYWIEVTEVRRLVDGGNAYYKMGARLHIRQLRVFDCSPSSQKQGRRYSQVCRGKRGDQYAGYALPFRIVTQKVDGIALALASSVLRISGEAKRDILRKNFIDTAKYLGQALFKEMAQLREFQLHAPVMNATFGSVYTVLGKSEDLRLNQGFDVYLRHVRGHLIYRGYIKIRDIGDNRMKMVDGQRVRVEPKAPYLTRAQIISTSGGINLEKGLMLYERPLIGFSFGFDAGLIPLANPIFAQSTPSLGLSLPLLEGTILMPAMRFSFMYDISNASNLNEFYFSGVLELGLGGGSDRSGFVLPFTASSGVIKKFYFFRNLAWLVGIRATGGYVLADSYSAWIIGGDVLTGLDVFITPNVSLSLQAGFRAITSLDLAFLSLGPWFTLGVFFTL
jgi:hypothetical protein